MPPPTTTPNPHTTPGPTAAAPGRGRGRGAWVDGLTGLAVASAALALLLTSARDFGMVWDEGHTVRRERVLAEWFARLAGSPGLDAFTPRSLERGWPFSREEPDGHPPFYALLGLAGWRLTRGWLDPLTAYRFGPMALASATLGVLYVHLARRFGRTAGWGAVGALGLMPRAVAHAHYAHYDMPMTCLWLLAAVAYAEGLRRPPGRSAVPWGLAFGLAVGLASGTKFTGWFAPVAPLLHALLAGSPGFVARRSSGREFGDGIGPTRTGRPRVWPPGLVVLAVGLPSAALVLWAIQPAWWFDPVGGVRRFLVSNLTRSQTKPIATLYLGRVYPFALPWHNTLVLSAVTVPLATLALGAWGAAVSLRRWLLGGDAEGLLWVLSWGVLMVVRALPSAPGHDGDRLILPSLMSLGVLAGLGAGSLAHTLRPRGLAWVAALAAAAPAAEGALGVKQLYPYTLSYYNAAAGGLRGAERTGFELTYYWDTIGPEFLDWARDLDRLARGRLELRFPGPLVNLPYLREWGDLPPDIRVAGFDPVEQPLYVLQRRRGLYHPYDTWLERHGAPVWTLRRQGVDLLRVYPFAQSLRAYTETRDVPIPPYLR